MIVYGTGTGEISYLHNDFYPLPSKVWINGESKDKCKKSCFLDEGLNNVTLVFDKEITSTQQMFECRSNIKEIDLTHFISSKLTNMNKMFFQCTDLEKITFGKNFDTSSVENMENLFADCFKLTSIDISSFNTSSVTTMNSMFRQMNKITSLDVSSFNTSKVVDMYDMFGYCYELESLNLSNFDTSNLKIMQGMFYSCSKLKSLDLSNFIGDSITTLESTFSLCYSLEYLNLANFYIKENTTIHLYTFERHPANIKYIVTDSKIQNILLEKAINNTNTFDRNDISQKGCNELSNEYNYTYKTICLKKCPNNTYQVSYNPYICFDEIPENFYLDSNDGIYKECYKSCKKCFGGGDKKNNNCSVCKESFGTLDDIKAIKNNCYQNCPYIYYFDKKNDYYCFQNDSCPENYKLIEEKKKCIDECKNDDKYLFEYNKKCYEKCPNGTERIFDSFECFKENETKIEIYSRFKDLGEYIIYGYMDNIFKNISKYNEDYIEVYGNITYQLTTSDNQKNKTRNNLSSIDLLNCENILRNIYDINDSLSLNILKVEYKIENLLIPIVGYEIYHPLNNSKLDLKYCNETIKLDIPVSIDEDKLFKYETNSEFYTDNCFSYTTDNGTDIILNDRKQEFIDNNLSLCENNCTYINYDKNTKQSACDCYIKNEIDLINDIIENPNKLPKNFPSEESSSINSNLLAMKCSEELFSTDGLKYNISSYILIFSIGFFLLSIILFVKCGYPSLESKMNQIIDMIQKKPKVKRLSNYHSKKVKKERKSTIKKNESNNPPKKINLKIINNLQVTNNKNSIGNLQQVTTYDQNNKKKVYKKMKTKKKKTFIKNNQNDKIINNAFNIFELNTLSYKDAILYDKRTCTDYYISLLKIKHPVLFTFCPIDDYNSLIIKLCMTVISFSIYYAINFAFFDDKTIHKIYADKGRYNFIYFIPKILISFVCSYSIYIIIRYIFLSERNILQVKIQNNAENAETMMIKEKKNLKIKYFIFFSSGIAFLLFFWYLLSSFGAVYQNTQFIVFENTLICFGISLIFPFFINIFPSVFRIISLNSETKSKECFYKFSKFLQIL